MNFPWDELNVIRSKIEKLEIETTEEEIPRKSEDGMPLLGFWYALSAAFRLVCTALARSVFGIPVPGSS